MSNPSGLEPKLAYSGAPFDRLSEQRGDEALLAKLRGGAGARYYALAGESIVLVKRGDAFDPALTPNEAAMLGEPLENALLGKENEEGRFCISLPPESVEAIKGIGFLAIDLRSIALQGLVSPGNLSALATAKALLYWHARHRFCSNCGAPSRVAQAGWRRDCPKCEGQHFPRTDPCVIMLAVRGDNCLLARQSRFPPGMWSALAGFVEPGESLEEAVRRETLEEAGLPSGRVRYFASQPWPFPASLMIGCFVEAQSDTLKIDEVELEAARWVSRAEAEALLTGKHPARQFAPPPIAIAHHLVKAFVARGDKLFD
ncbi:MAG: NAD(+) diphosphatase [Xanthobacteraceae bacterium]|nr:NAD(+) diphosphatase [Xanthobacteraceae bacterium]QYK45294.1 MAG: NAD(+) diphosphatase [Xanthobacteraceae bacterium]